MKRTIEQHAARFDDMATGYDDGDRPIYAACASRVIEAASPTESDRVLDLGTGTGAIAITLATDAIEVIGRDISVEMLAKAKEKAVDQGIKNVEFGIGRFREPQYAGDVDIVTSNYALHHLDDAAKRDAITRIATFEPKRFVLGDLVFFDIPDHTDLDYDPAVDDPASVGMLTESLTDAGFEISKVERMSDQAGVIVAREPREGWDA